MYPLLLKPEMKERVWGGQRLKELYKKDTSYKHTGESWEVACHDNGNSVVVNGELAGERLIDVIKANDISCLGYQFNEGDKFPLLVKFIDAADRLSVQVHPDDDYARVNENGEFGKSEAWYILDAKEGASLIIGIKEGVTKQEFISTLENGAFESVLNEVKVKAGDVIDIPAGLLHAIGEGIVLVEVQQNSDTTYRVYDWKRVGLDGKPRELHVQQSLEVIDFEGKISTELNKGIVKQERGYKITRYIDNKYFSLNKIEVESTFPIVEDRVTILVCINGSGFVKWGEGELAVKAGDTVVVPVSLSDVNVVGQLELLISVPKK